MARDISKLIFDIVDEEALTSIIELSENKLIGKINLSYFPN